MLKKESIGRILVGVIFLFLALFGTFVHPETGALLWQILADAYIGVSVFVGLVLMLFYGLEYFTTFDTEKFFDKNKRWQVVLAALLGVLPGCGGAIMVITQYVAGRLGFSSVVAVLAATMGDAAFLLLAQEPKTAFLVFGLSFVAGVVSGYVVELIHDNDFLREEVKEHKVRMSEVYNFGRWRNVWLFIFFPGLLVGLLDAFQVDIDALFGFSIVFWCGLFGGLVSILFWLWAPYSYPQIIQKEDKNATSKYWNQIILDTNFVTIWVILSFLVYELMVLWTGFDFSQIFKGVAIFMPLIATLVGFLPGCGPQIVITTLYLQGLVPLSAQISNAIGNDGDALFPALALAPRVGIYATLYTAVPALVFGYAWYFLFDK